MAKGKATRATTNISDGGEQLLWGLQQQSSQLSRIEPCPLGMGPCSAARSSMGEGRASLRITLLSSQKQSPVAFAGSSETSWCPADHSGHAIPPSLPACPAVNCISQHSDRDIKLLGKQFYPSYKSSAEHKWHKFHKYLLNGAPTSKNYFRNLVYILPSSRSFQGAMAESCAGNLTAPA